MAAASEGRVRRIIDYLNDGEELGIEGAVGSPPRSPATAVRLSLPRFRWPRLARLGGKGGSAKEKTVLVEEEVVAEKNEQAPVPVSTSVQQATPKCEPTSTSGTSHSDLGVGLSLVFLLAKTSDEFNKMVKVRAEMEALLKEVKLQVRETSCGGNGHDNMPEEPCNPESTTSSCVTHRNVGSASAHMEEQAVSSGTEAASCEKSSEDDECCGSVYGLEDESHTKLERLQVTYGSDIPLFAAEEELDSETPDDYRQEDDDDELGEVVADEDYVVDDDDDESEYNGVSAVELERRLHELLHERSRERIEELEAALRRAERKLAEKEMEVCLWKDTAKFALRQENELQ